MDQIFSILASTEVLVAALTIVSLVAPIIGLPAWATTIIVSAAGIAVKTVEQTRSGTTSEAKKEAAIKAVGELLPVVVRVLPGTARKIDHAVEACVNDLPTKSLPIDM